MIVLGIDGSLRGTGLAVLDWAGTKGNALHGEVVKVPAKERPSECLRRIRERLDALLAEYRPETAAIEGGFYFAKNPKTALVLGEVRGVCIAECAAAGVPIFEYSPSRAKQNVVGWGQAPKDQVARMVMSMLSMAECPPDDVTDAFAIALCHAHMSRGLAAQTPL